MPDSTPRARGKGQDDKAPASCTNSVVDRSAWMRGLPVAHPGRFLTVLAVVVIAADTFACLTGAPRWIGWAPSTVNAFQGLNRLADPIVGAVAAVVAGGARRFGLGPWGAAATRDRAAQVRAIVAPLVLCPLAVHLVALAAMAVATTSRGPSVGTGLWAVVSVATSAPVTAVWCLLGVAAGLRLPRVIAVAVAVLIPYVASVALDAYAYGTPAAVLTYANSGGFSTVRLTDATTVIRCLVWVLLAIVAFAAVARLRGRSSTIATVCLSLALTAGFANGYAMEPIPGAAERTCLGRAPTVCTPRAYSAVLPDYRRLVGEVWPDVPASMRRGVLDATRDDPARSIPASPTDGRNDPSLTVDRDASIAALGEALWPRAAACTSATSIDRSAFQVFWLRRFGIAIDGSASPSSPDYASIEGSADILRTAERLARMTPDARDRWVKAAQSDRSCSPAGSAS